MTKVRHHHYRQPAPYMYQCYIYIYSVSVATLGGKSIQAECTAHVKSVGRLLPGQVYVSTGGKLPCRKVIHAVGPKWQGGSRGEENELYEAVYSSLERAVQQRLASIAIPAIGSGVFGVPPPVSARSIVTAVVDFTQTETAASRLKEIHLIDNRDKVVNHLHEALRTAVGEEELELVDESAAKLQGPKPAGYTHNVSRLRRTFYLAESLV